MENPHVPSEYERPRSKWYVNFADFANMVKAFIGANYLYIAFAFSEAGLILGSVGMVIIALLTDHCCHLIVKTKHHGITKMLHRRQSNLRPNTSERSGRDSSAREPYDSGVDDDDTADNDFGDDERSHLVQSSNRNINTCRSDRHSKEHITKNMSYGDVGNLAFGSIGVGVVNFSIALTQFGFCINYFIFIGNTLHSLFPVKLCYNDSITSERVCDVIHDSDVKQMDLSSVKIIDKRSLSTSVFSSLTAVSTSVVPNMSTIVPDITTVAPNLTTLSPASNVTIPMLLIKELVYTAPDLRILVATPLLIFIMFALIRSVRYLGVISVIANFSILFGCVSVFGFLIHGFERSKSIVMFRLDGFPVFFGMATAAFEGIGLVIPVESSMVGNRHLFSVFLHGAILFLTVVLGGFGVLGYLRFGADVHQMLNTNIPSGNPIATAVNVGICLGILLTFPLQIFPVIEIMEKYLFSQGRIFGPQKKPDRAEREHLMSSQADSDEEGDPVVDHVPDTVPSWKRNILRILVVLVACGLAILLKDFFAYVGAFVGAVGSSVLAFILPCLFHLRICWTDLGRFIKVKDILIIVFGVFASIISVYSVIYRIVKHIDA